MASTQDDMIAELQRANAELRQALAERDAALAQFGNESSERIAYQAATINVLKVMSASPGDSQPVFDLIVRQARALCGGVNSGLYECDGGMIHCRAVVSSDWPAAEVDAFRARFPMPFSRDHKNPVATAMFERRIVHIRDEEALTDFPRGLGVRSAIAVPWCSENGATGCITLTGPEIGGYSDSQIELLKTFAEQAVIAITSAETYRALQARTADLQESLEYQTATGDVLKVISRSTFDLDPVLTAVAETAARLCDADQAMISRCEDGMGWLAANFGFPAEYEASVRSDGRRPIPHDSPSVSWRAIVEGRVVHIEDVSTVPGYARVAIDLGKQRTSLGVPLARDGKVIGCIVLARQRVEPFTERQMELVRTFADQAVIAIENTRLITEQQEALEQQTATAEVLQVINASPGDLTPVFQTMLDRALLLCGAAFGELSKIDGDITTTVAVAGMPAAFSHVRVGSQLRPGPGTASWRFRHGENLVHIADLVDTEAYRDGEPVRRTLVDDGGARALLAVPLRKDDALLGLISIFRQEPGPFTARQIALLENFAAQAVIAMENARLLTETREALEQQTATAELLQTINESPGNPQPVFDAMLEKAMHLCGVAFGFLLTWDGEIRHVVAVRGLPPAVKEYATTRMASAPSPGVMYLLETRRPHQILDLMEDDGYRNGHPDSRMIVDIGGVRTCLHVPLVKDDRAVGYFSFYRRDVREFSGKEVALLENFAAQAVIAMENARLLTETREALEQQTATAEVLQVINESPGDLAPVFDAVLERALRLCGAYGGGVFTVRDMHLKYFAFRGMPDAFAMRRLNNELPVSDDAPPHRMMLSGRTVTVVDTATDPWFVATPERQRETTGLGGARSVLNVPFMKDGSAVGGIALFRETPGEWPDRQIALLQNFAAQAVIAMENARLLTETREALDRQTATAEVLQVINTSPGNLQPVFHAMLEKAMALCEASFGMLRTFDGEYWQAAATINVPEAVQAHWRAPAKSSPGGAHERLVRGERVVHSAVAKSDEGYLSGSPSAVALVDVAGARTYLAVALRQDERLLGSITIYRQEARPFTARQITLLEDFAAQAVIAIENARLLTETREALEQQTATAEVLGVINASPGELAPVFEAILAKAHALCGVAIGSLFMFDGEQQRAVATHGLPEELATLSRRGTPRNNTVRRRTAGGVRPAQIVDIRAIHRSEVSEAGRLLLERTGVRTMLFVPLRKDSDFLGYISAMRLEVRPFSDKEIALLENFAAQAVIAMENARLLNEIRLRQDELRVTFENMGDGVAMFDETPRLVAWNSKFQEFFNVPNGLLAEHRTYAEYIRYLAERGDYGTDANVEDTIRQIAAMTGVRRTYERVRPDGRVIEIRNNPAPGGGFVLMFSDITERKRNEEAVRAARDAAEATLRELKVAQANLIQAEKMASLGQLTAGIAHEIKNPLNFVNNFAELSVDMLGELKQAIAPAEAALTKDQRDEVDDVVATLTSNLEKINEHGKRADGIVKAMLEHSRGASGERRTVDINALADEALNLAYHGARAQDQSFNITLERDFGDGIAPIEVNPQDITRVLLNLFSNAFYAANRRAKDGGDTGFNPTLKVTTRGAGDRVEIRVRDNGTGIPADIRDKLFQPFFTTKPTGEGTGLGLSITYDIVTKQHGGTIAVDSEVNEFTEFVVTLPPGMFAGEGRPA